MSIMQITQTVQILPSLPVRYGKKIAQPMLPGLEAETVTPPTVSNRQIAEVLASVADMIERQNGNPYRIQAYRNAARGVLDLSEAATDILARGAELPIPGLGQRLRKRIAELINSGSMTINNGFCLETLPAGVIALMTIEHIGPYTAIRLQQELSINNVEDLWQAAYQHRIRSLPGFGARSEARLKIAAEKILNRSKQRNNHLKPLGGAA
jgi:DNA polymerase/3'-5' exonuclease PolX